MLQIVYGLHACLFDGSTLRSLLFKLLLLPKYFFLRLRLGNITPYP